MVCTFLDRVCLMFNILFNQVHAGKVPAYIKIYL